MVLVLYTSLPNHRDLVVADHVTSPPLRPLSSKVMTRAEIGVCESEMIECLGSLRRLYQ